MLRPKKDIGQVTQRDMQPQVHASAVLRLVDVDLGLLIRKKKTGKKKRKTGKRQHVTSGSTCSQGHSLYRQVAPPYSGARSHKNAATIVFLLSHSRSFSIYSSSRKTRYEMMIGVY